MIQEYLFALSDQDKILSGILASLMLSMLIVKYTSLYKLRHKKSVISSVKQGVSVIITSKNDGAFLRKNLDKFIKQDYPNFEVIVIDNCSFDDTQIILADYVRKYPNFRFSTINPDDKFTLSKKFALNIGIKAAKNDILIFSEANCFPVSDKWIDHIQSAFKPEVDVVIAYSNFVNDGSFLSSFLIYDRFIRIVRSLSFSMQKFAYRGDGANIAYRKTAYFENNFFSGNAQTEVGYDSLPVVKMNKNKEIEVVIHPESHVLIDYMSIYKEWKDYKTLYYLSRFFCKKRKNFFINLMPLLKVANLIVLVVFLVLSEHVFLILSMFMIYESLFIVHKIILTNVLHEKKLFVYSLYADLVIGVLSFVQFLKARFTWFYGTTFKFIR
ncbi:MAG: glycosyltransferase [Marinifilaceae bacterium]